MKAINKLLIVITSIITIYTTLYLAFRFSKILIHQSYITSGCDKTFYLIIQKEFPKAKSISVVSERHEIGAPNMVSIKSQKLIESIIVPFFYPLEELEMIMRGYYNANLECSSHKTDDVAAEIEESIFLKEYIVSRRFQSKMMNGNYGQ